MMRSYRQYNTALGSTADIIIVTGSSAKKSKNILNEIWRQIFTFEKQFSRFIPESELSRFNKNSGTKQFITDDFKKLLKASKKISIESKGIYNPFILPALQKAGYTKSFVDGTESDVYDDYSKRTVVNIDRLEIEDDWARIPYGTAIDIGGCGKGYLADCLADLLDGLVDGYSISLGGDIVTAGHDENNKNWIITIQNSSEEETSILGEITMPKERFSISSSGIFIKKGIKANKEWHHIINPETLLPAETDIMLSTVCHEKALYSDVLASCSIILGSTKSFAYLKSFKVDNACLQLKEKNNKQKYLLLGKEIKLHKVHDAIN